MWIAQVVLIVLAFALLAAHFLHAGWAVAMGVCLMAPMLLWIRRWWAARLMQAMLLVGATEWVRTTAMLVEGRQEAGLPYVRLVAILGGVVLITLLAAAGLQTGRSGRRFFGRGGGLSRPSAGSSDKSVI